MTNEEAKQRGYQLEEAIKELIRGKLTPGSGSGNQKGDVKSPLFHIEAKFKSHSDELGPYLDLDLQWLEAIWRHSQNQTRGVERIPALALEWVDRTRFILIPLPWYQRLGGVPRGLNGHYYGARKARIRSHEVVSRATVKFDRIEVPEPVWVFLDMEELVELRKEHQPAEEPPKKQWKSRGFRR